MKKTPGRTCIPSGYMYEYDGKRNWKRSSQERWETVVHKAMCGRKVGERVIDGSRVTVITVGKRFYAALSHYVRKAP